MPLGQELHQEIRAVVGPHGLITESAQRRTYESDGLTGYRREPGLVVLPASAEEVAAVVELCDRHEVPIVARGAGTGLSGGALPHEEGVLVVLTRMRRILEVDVANRSILVEPGVTNSEISQAIAPHGLYYAPDPSSQIVCTIGGNIAENSGGAHCLKYGFTTNHTQGVEVVLSDGTLVWLGDDGPDPLGYDLRGVFIGSEGTLGLATKIRLRLLRRPQSVRTLVADYASPADAGHAVTAIIDAGIVPAAVEMLDHLAINACEGKANAGFSVDAGAALIVEVDGPESECADDFQRCEALCREAGAQHIRIAEDGDDRARIWKGRKAAFAAMGRLSPQYFVQDGVIPRTQLGECLATIAAMASAAGLRVANVFHAGDGNLHPLVLYDETVGDEAQRAERLSAGIAELCVELGGSLTGEHGVGVDKVCSMPKMFSETDLDVMARVRSAWDPSGRCNPDKLLPTPRLCGERPGPYRPHPLEEAGLIERM